MRITPAFDHSNVTLLGRFNPAIFHPSWLAAHGIVGQEDASEAKLGIVHQDIAQFEVGRITLVVEQGKFSAQSLTVHRDLLLDLTRKAFGELLVHTPVQAIGVNRMVHFACPSVDVRNKVGLRLAPQEPWGDWASKLPGDPGRPETLGGMVRLVMQQTLRDDGYQGAVRAKIEPSSQIPDGRGIYMDINDEFRRNDDGSGVSGSAWMVDTLERNWQACKNRAELIIDQIMALVEGIGGAR